MFPQVNYLAVLVSGIALFILGGLWYSPALFAKKWIALHGKTQEQMKAEAAAGPPMAGLMGFAFVAALIVSWVLAIILNHFQPLTLLKGVEVAVLCWLGFAGVTSLSTAMFSMKPKALWAIDSGYNLVSLIIAALILTAWR
jgi:hypothetical protein